MSEMHIGAVVEDDTSATTLAERRPSRGRRRHEGTLDAVVIAQETRADILRAATAEFIRNGLDGTSINEIARGTNTSKRMIYYYFGGKENLYRAVLEAAYERTRRHGLQAELRRLAPMAALHHYAGVVFDAHWQDHDLVKLLMIENLNEARTIRDSAAVRARTAYSLELLAGILQRGVAAGEMREGVTPLDLYLTITGLSFHVSAAHATLQVSVGVDFQESAAQAQRRAHVLEVLTRLVAA